MKKSQIKKLDLLWSKKVKDDKNDACESCLSTHLRVEAAHIIGRTYRTTRWGCIIDGEYDIAGMCLCVDCHQHYDQHKKKHDFIVRVVIGQDRYEKLVKTRQVIAKHQDYDEIKKNLTMEG